VDATAPLESLEDPDSQSIAGDWEVTGALDYPGDTDLFELDLEVGMTVSILLASVAFDPFLVADVVVDGRAYPVALADSGGGGVFGTDALLQLTAPVSGRYQLTAVDAGGGPGHFGGYVLSVSPLFIDNW
jgi:hypothetical protein